MRRGQGAIMKPTPIAGLRDAEQPGEACRSRSRRKFQSADRTGAALQITVTVSSVTRNRLRAKSRKARREPAYKRCSCVSGAGERGPGVSRSKRMAR